MSQDTLPKEKRITINVEKVNLYTLEQKGDVWITIGPEIPVSMFEMTDDPVWLECDGQCVPVKASNFREIPGTGHLVRFVPFK